MLGDKLDEHGSTVWLVNTGWTGGPYGEGERMPISATRALLTAALSGQLDGVEYRTDELFGFEVPASVPGVDSSLLDPRSTWRDPVAYDERARELAQMFRDNFAKFADDGRRGGRGRRARASEVLVRDRVGARVAQPARAWARRARASAVSLPRPAHRSHTSARASALGALLRGLDSRRVRGRNARTLTT